MTLSARLTGAAALALVAACSESPTAPAVTADTAATVLATRNAAVPNATVAASVTVVGCNGASVVLSADEKRGFDLHNQQRATSGLTPFCVHPALTAAARAHSQDMLAKGYFSHMSQNGDSFVTRVVRAGYTGWRSLAENIAWGSGSYGTPERIFANWMNSTGHRTNILNANLREIGVGAASGTFQGYAGARIYTADFGAR